MRGVVWDAASRARTAQKIPEVRTLYHGGVCEPG